jgi:predicted metal-dependent phosphoesterase TrpH
MLIDMHIHTRFSSCSEMRLRDAMDQAHALGVDGLCVTDHHSRGAARLIQEGPQENGLVVLVGQEYATAQGDFLLFGPLPELAPLLSAPQLLHMVDEAGGVAIGAHPFRRGRSLDPKLFETGHLHFIEGINGRNHAEENELAMQWGLDHGLGLLGGSDAHRASELGAVLTEFKQTIRNQDDLVEALKSGAFEAHWSSDFFLQDFCPAHFAAASLVK